MKQKELDKVLELHKKWLNDEEGGVKANLKYANLRNANLRNANLRNANLTCADLKSADLKNANLCGAYLRGADLTGADLTSAYLTGAYLTGAHLTGADLTGADLTGAHLACAYLKGADLTGADLTNAYLTNANLTNANLTNANLTNANLKGVLNLPTISETKKENLAYFDLSLAEALKEAVEKDMVFFASCDPDCGMEWSDKEEGFVNAESGEKIVALNKGDRYRIEKSKKKRLMNVGEIFEKYNGDILFDDDGNMIVADIGYVNSTSLKRLGTPYKGECAVGIIDIKELLVDV